MATPRRRRRVPQCATHRFIHHLRPVPPPPEPDEDYDLWAEWQEADNLQRQADFQAEHRADARMEA